MSRKQKEPKVYGCVTCYSIYRKNNPNLGLYVLGNKCYCPIHAPGNAVRLIK